MTRRTRVRRRRLLTAACIAVLAAALALWFTRGAPAPLVLQRCTATVAADSTSMSAEQAANAATIVGIAVRRGLPARAATIAIATAIQESGLRNLDHGDRDSLGLFQQRPSQGWGTPAQVQDPVYATNTFYDRLVKVPGYRDLPVTDAAQQVQRSGFPLAYGNHEREGRLVASTLTGFSPGGFSCRLTPVAVADPGPGADNRPSARAKALTAAIATQVSPQAPSLVAGTGGRALQYAPGAAAADSSRTAWALAGWAVASAGQYAVDEVSVAGSRWTRTGGNWTPRATGVPAGSVQIRVAP